MDIGDQMMINEYERRGIPFPSIHRINQIAETIIRRTGIYFHRYIITQKEPIYVISLFFKGNGKQGEFKSNVIFSDLKPLLVFEITFEYYDREFKAMEKEVSYHISELMDDIIMEI